MGYLCQELLNDNKGDETRACCGRAAFLFHIQQTNCYRLITYSSYTKEEASLGG